MKYLIEATVLSAVLLVGNVAARADEAADTAVTPAAPSAPAAPVADEDNGVHVKIDLDTGGSDATGDKSLIDIDADEDGGPVGRVIRKGVAGFLEEHVLTRDDLDESDRKEVQDAIAELRGEMKDAGREIADTGKEIDHEVGKSVAKKHHVFLNKATAHDSADDDGFGAFQAIVAITAIIFTLGMPIIIVAAVLYFAYRRRRLAHDTINQFLASGKEIPPEIMQNLFKDAGTTAATPKNNLHRGTVNAGIGIGMVIGFNAIDAHFLAAIGFVFLLVGLAQLLIWKLEKGKNGDKPQG